MPKPKKFRVSSPNQRKRMMEMVEVVSDLMNAIINTGDVEVKGKRKTKIEERKTCENSPTDMKISEKKRGIFNESYRERHRKGV